MACAVVYYSLEGSTKAVAERLAKELDASLIAIESEKKYPTSGFAKFMVGGKDALFGTLPKLKPYSFDDGAFDTVVIATPVWADKASAPMRAFLAEHKLDGKKVGAAILSASGDASKCVADLAKSLGRSADELTTMSLKSDEAQDSRVVANAVSGFAQNLLRGTKRSSGAF